MEIFVDIYKSYISHEKAQRTNAEKFINQILDRRDPQDISFLLESLVTIDNSNENYSLEFFNSIKLFISMILKKIFESCITEENYNLYNAYLSNAKYEIIKIILNLKSDIKTLNFLIVIIENLIIQFKEIFNHNDISALIFNFYCYSKENHLNESAFRSLYIFFKVLKIVSNFKREEECQKNEFLTELIQDFCKMLNSFTEFIIFNQNQQPMQLQSLSDQQIQFIIKYINLYFKIFKHSVNFMNKENRVIIMNKTYEFLHFILFKINPNLIDKNLFDAIFIANKILLKYIAYVSRVDLKIIKNFSELFYEYVKNSKFYSCINNIIKSNYSNYGEYSEKEKKFLTNIIDFFKELMQLNSNDNWGDLLFFKDCFSDDLIKISDYLETEFFTNERYENIIYFIIKNCMFFTSSDVEMFNNDIEEFYIWYDNLNPMYDLREKAGLLARIIYDRNKQTLKEIFSNLEKELLKLCEKENPEYFGYQGIASFISPEEANLKCGLLYFFECLCFIYYNKHKDYDLWVNKILFSHFDSLRKNRGDIFSKFIIFRIFIKIIDFKEINPFKDAIFMNIYEIFMLHINNSLYHYNNEIQYGNVNNVNLVKYSEDIYLLKFAAVDFFFSYFEEIFTQNFPSGFLSNYVKETCILFKHVNSPIIHNKLIKTTLNILNIFNEDDIAKSFNDIFPIIKALWLSNFENYNYNSNIIKRNMISISVLRKNLFQLISIFVKKIGIFYENDLIYFQFVYEIIGYALTSKNAESGFIFTEGLKTLLLIQDEFYSINRSKNFDLCYPKDLNDYIDRSLNFKINAKAYNNLQSIYEFTSYQNFIKLYDFLSILLDTLMISDDYFIVILKIIEQFISLIFTKEIREFIFDDNSDIIRKLMTIINNLFTKHINIYHQPIFNFIEFCLYCLNSIDLTDFSNSSNNNFNKFILKISEFNNFIYNLINNFQTNFQNSNFNAINLSENDETLLNVLLGTIQISNRLIFVNFKNQTFDLLFNKKVIDFIVIITNNIELTKKLNIIHKRIIYNLLFNLERLTNLINKFFNQAPNYNYGIVCSILDLLKNLQVKFKEYNNLNYIDKYTHTQNHWLYFFEKIGSNTQFYNLTMEEENLKFYWNGKFENTNFTENDLGEINYEIKYAILVNDTLYKTDPNEQEEEIIEENPERQLFG